MEREVGTSSAHGEDKSRWNSGQSAWAFWPLFKEASMAAGVLVTTAVNVSLLWIALLQSGLVALDVWYLALKQGSSFTIILGCPSPPSYTLITCFLCGEKSTELSQKMWLWVLSKDSTDLWSWASCWTSLTFPFSQRKTKRLICFIQLLGLNEIIYENGFMILKSIKCFSIKIKIDLKVKSAKKKKRDGRSKRGRKYPNALLLLQGLTNDSPWAQSGYSS